MMQTFPEVAISGVLIAPFVLYAALALMAFLVLRPVLALMGFDRCFANPPMAQLSVYVLILAMLIVFV